MPRKQYERLKYRPIRSLPCARTRVFAATSCFGKCRYTYIYNETGVVDNLRTIRRRMYRVCSLRLSVAVFRQFFSYYGRRCAWKIEWNRCWSFDTAIRMFKRYATTWYCHTSLNSTSFNSALFSALIRPRTEILGRVVWDRPVRGWRFKATSESPP